MAQPSLRPPSYLQPRPKAVPTSSSAAIAAKGSTPSTPQLSTPINQSRQTSPARPIASTDVSDKATAALVRRVLCPNSHAAEPRPVDELLPPLTSSNDVDLQLYAIIAIVVKDLVHSWYSKITPDQTFVEEVAQIVAHCTRALESRLRTVDLESLLLDEIPELVERHIKAYRVSHQAVHPPPLSTDPRIIYHILSPHPALSPIPEPAIPSTIDEQSKNETDYRQLLVQAALAILLPTEDLENACLRTLVADVIAESILGNAIGGKVSEGWFIWGSIIKLVEVVKAKVHPRATGEAIKKDTRGRLEKFGLLTEKEEKNKTGKHRHGRRSTLSSLFWMILQYMFLTAIGIRFVVVGFFAAASQPLRSSALARPTEARSQSPIEKGAQSPARQLLRPTLSFSIFPLLSTLLDLPLRMPWLSGALSLLQHHLIHGPFRVGSTDGMLDQYIHTLLTTHLSPHALLPPSLLLLRQTIFPHNTLPPPSPSTPSAAQIQQTRRDCAEALLSLLPQAVTRHLFGEDEIGEVEAELEVWGDQYANKHLLYAVVELVVVRVLPEMGSQGTSDLLRERIGGDEKGGLV